MPATGTELRFSGFIQLSIVHDFQNSGFPGGYNWFVPIMIPAPTDHTPNTAFDAHGSRFNFEIRTNTAEVGSMRTTISLDFYGNIIDPLKDSFLHPRLREAYVTWVGPKSKVSFTLGHT